MIRTVHLPRLRDEHRAQGLRMLDSGINPRTGLHISPEMRAALQAMRPAIRSNLARNLAMVAKRDRDAAANRAESPVFVMPPIPDNLKVGAVSDPGWYERLLKRVYAPGRVPKNGEDETPELTP